MSKVSAHKRQPVVFPVLRTSCGQLPVVVGAARARDLCALSFADVLDERAQSGYQRPYDRRHAREFRGYIEGPEATTIPLTFNLRGAPGTGWRLEPRRPVEGARALLEILIPREAEERVMAQVDCQHRLGMMQDSAIPLTFHCLLGLTPLQEMRIFNVINSKAKGLSPSLLDYHDTQILQDLAASRPHLFIAKKLHDDAKSVWFGRLKLGGSTTQGAHRRVSLRGMQNAVDLFLSRSVVRDRPILEQYEIVSAFWEAVAMTWPRVWNRPRE